MKLRPFSLLLPLILLALSPLLSGCPCGCKPPPEPDFARKLSGDSEKTYKLLSEMDSGTDSLPLTDSYRHTFVKGGIYRLTKVGVGTNIGTWQLNAAGDSLFTSLGKEGFPYDGPLEYELLGVDDTKFTIRYRYAKGSGFANRQQVWEVTTK